MITVQEDRRPYALVVDDDGLLRMDVCEILEAAGFRTLEAEDGDAAILMLEQHHLDVTLMFSDGFVVLHLSDGRWWDENARRWHEVSAA